MEHQDVRSEVVAALRRYGFYIFDRSKQEQIREVMRALGDLRSLVKVRGLPHNANYFMLEVDVYSYEASCRDRCFRNGVFDPHCYGRCLTDTSRSLVEKVVAALRGQPQ